MEDYVEEREVLVGAQRQQVVVVRKHITPYAACLLELERRPSSSARSVRDRRFLQPSFAHMRRVLPPASPATTAADCITSHFLLHGYNKRQKSAVNAGCWAPDGRRLVCGTNAGEFTLWQGDTFKFERIVSTHDDAVRALAWSASGSMLISGDAKGNIKYFASTMAYLQNIEAHREQVRGLSFAPSDSKFASCSDDKTVIIWDLESRKNVQVLSEHRLDVRCVAWHPFRSLVASGSKDNEVKLWDPRAGSSLATLFGHKNTVLAVAWNPSNGNWLATSGRDHLVKLYDIRMNREWLTLQGHDREVCSLAWHPTQEGLLTSGGFNGSLAYWVISQQAGGQLTPHTYLGHAHNYSVNMIAWHGFGHLLATASNDGIVKFWSREPPGSSLALHQEDSQEQQLDIQYGPRLDAQESSADSDPFAADKLNTHLEEIRAPDAGAKSLRLRNPLPSVSSKIQSLVTITDAASKQQKRKRLLAAPS